ncbi:unnamed protein product, partial [marine sediment metagenome]
EPIPWADLMSVDLEEIITESIVIIKDIVGLT